MVYVVKYQLWVALSILLPRTLVPHIVYCLLSTLSYLPFLWFLLCRMYFVADIYVWLLMNIIMLWSTNDAQILSPNIACEYCPWISSKKQHPGISSGILARNMNMAQLAWGCRWKFDEVETSANTAYVNFTLAIFRLPHNNQNPWMTSVTRTTVSH